MPRPTDTNELRAAVFAFLAELQGKVGPYVRRADVNGFSFRGQPLRLMEQGGITKLAGWSEALAIIPLRRLRSAAGTTTRTVTTAIATTATCEVVHRKHGR